MSVKNRFWKVPPDKFQAFDLGETISDLIPFSWDLQVGDRLDFDADDALYGWAEVVSVDDEPLPAGFVRCGFKKLM